MANIKLCAKCGKIGLDQLDFYIRWGNKYKRFYYRSWCIDCEYENYDRKRHRKRNYKHNYNMTINDYDNMFNKQDGRCAICGSGNSNRKSSEKFYVDHNHETGKIRGLLCHNCNSALGHIKDDTRILQNMLHYIRLKGR